MADDERRAEIEAVAAVLRGGGDLSWRAVAAECIAALDRVRDARGDDERFPVTADGFAATDDRTGPSGEKPARSPQGEDHEDEWITLELLCDGVPACGSEQALSILKAAGHEVDRERVKVRLSRVSPSRDGTVAVEDVVTFVRCMRDGGRLHTPEAVASAIKRKFSPASTGDREVGA